jgi:Stress responsive A/B Barrel Domain.
MLTHVVCFQFADPADAAEAVRRLAAMDGRIDALQGIEVGLDVTRSDRSYDVALITRHADAAGLAAYQADPVHQDVLVWIRGKGPKAVAVDFVS